MGLLSPVPNQMIWLHDLAVSMGEEVDGFAIHLSKGCDELSIPEVKEALRHATAVQQLATKMNDEVSRFDDPYWP